jgi:hypothetical protein
LPNEELSRQASSSSSSSSSETIIAGAGKYVIGANVRPLALFLRVRLNGVAVRYRIECAHNV